MVRKGLLLSAIATIRGPRPSDALGESRSGRRMHEVPVA